MCVHQVQGDGLEGHVWKHAVHLLRLPDTIAAETSVTTLTGTPGVNVN